jgi:hypothetical protein
MKVDELTVRFEEDGVLKVRELDKRVLSQGTWATVAFLSQELDLQTQQWRAPRVTVRRYRKRGQGYVVDKHITLTSPAQATALADTILSWFGDSGAGSAAAAAAIAAADDEES